MVYLVHRTGCAEAVDVETTSANARALIDFIALPSDYHGAKSRTVNYVPDACCYGLKARELVVFFVGTIGIETGQLGLDRRQNPALPRHGDSSSGSLARCQAARSGDVGRRSRPASSAWQRGHLNWISRCAEADFWMFADIGHTPHWGHFSSRVSDSIIASLLPAPTAAQRSKTTRVPNESLGRDT